MDYRIHGTTMQSLEVELSPGETLFSEVGCLLFMEPQIELNTSLLKGNGGLFGAAKRSLTGNSVVLNHYANRKEQTHRVGFSTRMPGHILPLEIGNGKEYVVQKHAFLCAEESIHLNLGMFFNLAGIFGGNGILMNRLSGEGYAFISVDGETLKKELQAGETLLVHPAHVAAYEGSVDYQVVRMKGIKNFLFSGDGLALVQLTGPGTVYLHTLNIHQLASELMETQPQR